MKHSMKETLLSTIFKLEKSATISCKRDITKKRGTEKRLVERSQTNS